MDQKDLAYFKDLLTNWLRELLNQADSTVLSLKDQGDNLPDPTDRASFEADRSFMLRIRDRESRLIHKIRRALEDIEAGTFGICETCGEDIALARLYARPVATECIECKTKREALEKASGY